MVIVMVWVIPQVMKSVVINNIRSAFHKIETGILQGTVLGPILFSLYSNDLQNMQICIDLHMYAGDTMVHVSVPFILFHIS